MRSTLLVCCCAAALNLACGCAGKDSPEGGPSQGEPTGVFAEVEDCTDGAGYLRGTVDGHAVDQRELMSNWQGAKLHWGMGESDGTTWEFLLSMTYDHWMAPTDPDSEWQPPVDFAALEDFTDTAIVTGGWYYAVPESASGPGDYYCLTDGVIGQHTRSGDSPPTTLKWRITGARQARDCSGERVSIDLRGCLTRDQLIAP